MRGHTIQALMGGCARASRFPLAVRCALLTAFATMSVAMPAGGQSINYSTLYTFGVTSGSDGKNPAGSLIQGTDGNFYGLTAFGGAYGAGAVYKITPSGTETVLYSFKGGSTDGIYPVGSLIQASDGNFYGATDYGGAHDEGVVFKVTPSGTETVLYSFGSSSTDGRTPYAGLIQASDGNFYGTTTAGGTGYGAGTVYKLTPDGTETVLYSFQQSNTDGGFPDCKLIQAKDGNFYGTTENGGPSNWGTVFKLTPAGTQTMLYAFKGRPDGGVPQASVIQASDGNFYGTTYEGGVYTTGNYGGPNSSGYGTFFEVTPSGAETVLYSFGGSSTDGIYPESGLIQASDGNFYGTNDSGGDDVYGTIFKLTPSGTETVLHSFGSSSSDGIFPLGLIQASSGSFYGVCSGGPNTTGTVFAFSLNSSAPVLSKIAPASADAAGPAFTLSVYGSNFTSDAVVKWTLNGSTTSLTTTFVSSTKLTASVPASLIASPGKATITVVTSGGASNSKTFIVLETTLKLTAASLTKNSNGTYTANITLKNIGYKTAPSTGITKSTLGAASTSTTLPVSLGNIAAGATATTSLSFPASAGTPGTIVSLKVSGTFTGGNWSVSARVTLP